jgi:uncharacterized protein with PQ loop repeat
MPHSKGLHHFEKRKRIHEKHEPYPHPDRLKRFIDKAIYVVGILGFVMTIPQLAKIWLYQNPAGVSVITWASYLIFAVFWVIYGLAHKDRPIIVTFSLLVVMDALIVIGVLLHGGTLL